MDRINPKGIQNSKQSKGKGSRQQQKFVQEVKKQRIRILPNLYKMTMRIFQKLPDIEASQAKVFDEIDRRMGEMFAGDSSVREEVTLKELMKFYLDTHRMINQTAEVTRRFLIYFPMEIDTETREMIVILKSMPKSLRQRVQKYIFEIAMDRQKLPKFGTTEYKARIEEMQEEWERECEQQEEF